MEDSTRVTEEVINRMLSMATPENRIAYVTMPIDESWISSGYEFYDTLPKRFQDSLAIILPDDMPIDFYVGAVHMAESSNVGSRICHIITNRSAIPEFIEKLNALVARINEGGL